MQFLQISNGVLPRLKDERVETISFPVERSLKKVLRKKKPRHDRRTGPRQILVVLTCLGMTGTFAYHAIHGRHGLETRSRLISRSEGLEFEIRGLETVRARLQRDVALLSSTPPDSDLVAEIARDVLGFVHAEDRILTQSR